MKTTMKPEEEETPLSVTTATRMLDCFEGYTYALLRSGKLSGRKVAGRWRIDAASVATHLRKRAARESAEKVSAA
jgi:excisionase family DNA binding protein